MPDRGDRLFPWVLGAFIVILLLCLGGGAVAGVVVAEYGDVPLPGRAATPSPGPS